MAFPGGAFPIGFNRFPLGADKFFPYEILVPPDPSVLPITLAQAKQWLRVANPLDTSEDTLITNLIKSASIFCQNYTKITFFTTTFVTYRDYFGWSFQLRKWPIPNAQPFPGGVPIVEYLNDRIFIPVDPTIYFLTHAVKDYPQIQLWPFNVWPDNLTTSFWRDQSVRITFTAGYGPDASTIPESLITGMLNHIAAAYENRGDCSDCGAGCNSANLPTESRNQYNMEKIISVGACRI